MKKRIVAIILIFFITNITFTEILDLFVFELKLPWYLQIGFVILCVYAAFPVKMGTVGLLSKFVKKPPILLWMPFYFSSYVLFIVLLDYILPILSTNFISALYLGFVSSLLVLLSSITTNK